MEFIAHFFAGAFLCNCIPHLAAGLQGQFFPTPFARLHGSHVSSPIANVLWGSLNLALGALLLQSTPVSVGFNIPFLVFLLGFVGLGVFLAWRFQRVMGHTRG